MKKLAALLAVLVLLPVNAYAWPWSTDMMNQPNIKPQEPVEGTGAPAPFPKRSVPVSGIPTTVKDRDGANDLANPIPVSAESLKQGKVLFTIYCSACHGPTGQADVPISELLGAANLVEDGSYQDPTQFTDGYIWGAITFGAAMPAYGVLTEDNEMVGSNDLSVEERWHVVNYVRHQLRDDAIAAGMTP